MFRQLMKLPKEEKDLIIDKGFEVSLSLLLEGTLAQVVPGLVALKSSYKQMKSEKRILITLQEIFRRQEELELAINKLSDEDIPFYENEVFSLVIDIAEQETQKEKIKLIINGFETILEDNILDENKIITYYDVLKELRIIDIRRLLQHTSKYYEIKRAKSLELLPQRDQEDAENEHFKNYIDNKLGKLGLIGNGIRTDSEIKDYDGLVTPFGQKFLRFIKCEFKHLDD
ncbi:hypothetical protein [Bacillus safensis]|uniref:hypothetical protein n=1 Tax=Bacillus safensis TaxID=561879 RepID=UPI000B43EB09|nr:hypothetical protein [Bacillus safensis]UDB47223.1 hypothetical protein B0X07_17895 [Bacillus safensis]